MKTNHIKTYAATIQRTTREYAECEVEAESRAEAERLLVKLCDSPDLEWEESSFPAEYRTAFLREK